jgi:hypothetical protein
MPALPGCAPGLRCSSTNFDSDSLERRLPACLTCLNLIRAEPKLLRQFGSENGRFQYFWYLLGGQHECKYE